MLDTTQTGPDPTTPLACLLDIGPAVHQRAGLSRYAERLATHLAALPPKKQIGTALFFKECLANIIRHAQASRVVTAVTASPRELVLTVTDNGRGLPAAGSGAPTPPSLIRRARLLGGSAIAFPNQAGGTVVTLRIPLGSRWLWG